MSVIVFTPMAQPLPPQTLLEAGSEPYKSTCWSRKCRLAKRDFKQLGAVVRLIDYWTAAALAEQQLSGVQQLLEALTPVITATRLPTVRPSPARSHMACLILPVLLIARLQLHGFGLLHAAPGHSELEFIQLIVLGYAGWLVTCDIHSLRCAMLGVLETSCLHAA